MVEMRSYDDVIDVRRGLVAGQEAPEQFLWRDRLWIVRDVLAHWVETGAWWEQTGVAALLGVWSVHDPRAAADNPAPGGSSLGGSPLGGPRLGADLLGERDVWRVEAGRGRLAGSTGVFDLAFDWGDAQWRLIGCAD